MNVIFLSPHFPPHFFHFCMNLKMAGANVLGIGDEPYDKLSEDVRGALTEYYQVDDMHNYDALVRACGFFTHRYGKIDRLDSLNEYWLSTEARLRDDFNIFGVRGNEIDYHSPQIFYEGQFSQGRCTCRPGSCRPNHR